MTVRDVYNGQSGEWREGMWFPDPKFNPQPSLTMQDSRVWEQHSRDIGEERIERIREEFGRQCEEYNLRRAGEIHEENERRAVFVVGLIVALFVTLWVIRMIWGVV